MSVVSGIRKGQVTTPPAGESEAKEATHGRRNGETKRARDWREAEREGGTGEEGGLVGVDDGRPSICHPVVRRDK